MIYNNFINFFTIIQGGFLLLNNEFEIVRRWGNEGISFNYDFWYQPYFNTMVNLFFKYINMNLFDYLIIEIFIK
jgi:hypothetical protein